MEPLLFKPSIHLHSISNINRRAEKGDVNVYVSNRERKPNRMKCSWYSHKQIDHSISISNIHPLFKIGTFFITIEAYQSDSTFTLLVTEGISSFEIASYLKLLTNLNLVIN